MHVNQKKSFFLFLKNQRLLSVLTSQSNGKLIPEGRSALLGKFHKLKVRNYYTLFFEQYNFWNDAIFKPVVCLFCRINQQARVFATIASKVYWQKNSGHKLNPFCPAIFFVCNFLSWFLLFYFRWIKLAHLNPKTSKTMRYKHYLHWWRILRILCNWV